MDRWTDVERLAKAALTMGLSFNEALQRRTDMSAELSPAVVLDLITSARSVGGDVVELREAFRHFVDAIKHAPISWETGYCCCGSSVEGHGFGDGHSPVDAGFYFVSNAVSAAETVLDRGSAVGVVERDPFKAVLASLVAAVSILEDAYGRKLSPNKVVGSDMMFRQMLADYNLAIVKGGAALSRIEAGGGALPAQGPSVPTEQADRAVVGDPWFERLFKALQQDEPVSFYDMHSVLSGEPPLNCLLYDALMAVTALSGLAAYHHSGGHEGDPGEMDALCSMIAVARQQAAVSPGEQPGIGAADEPKDIPHPAKSDSSTGGAS